MKELLYILDRTTRLRQNNQRYALATVVKIGGSTYRRPGARMLITEQGEYWGTISGGCLEGEVAQQALAVIENQEPRLIPFNLEEDDIVLGFGTGCNGIVHVLIQPISPENTNTAIDALLYCISTRKRGVMATIISVEGEQDSEHSGSTNPLGKHFMLIEDGSKGPSSLELKDQNEIRSTCQDLLNQELEQDQIYLWQTHQMNFAGKQVEVLFEIVRPPVRLYVFGEGHDVGAVVAQAHTLGWDVVLVGRKPVDVLKDRFPDATDHVFLMHPDQVTGHITPDARSAALVMNHTYIRDKALMHALLHSEMPYTGMLGAERTDRNHARGADERKQKHSSTSVKQIVWPCWPGHWHRNTRRNRPFSHC